MDWLTPLIIAGASFAGAWGAMRLELRYLRRDVTRAHLRLDAIRAPNITLE